MRSVMYLAALLLALPQMLLCAVFLLLEHLTSGGTLGSLVPRAFAALFALLNWKGLLVFLSFVALVALGFSSRFRWIGAATWSALIVASAAILVWILARTLSPSDVFFLLPGAGALALSIRLIVIDRPAWAGLAKKLSTSHKNPASVSF
jgi:hypothetical protein